MARRTPSTSLRQISEINLTPLMDLTFILLITFIITFPLMEQGIPVNLPKASSEDLGEDRSRTVTINNENQVFLDNKPISLTDLKVRLDDLSRGEPDLSIMIRADERIVYGKLVEVMKIMHETGVSKMALVTSEGEGRR